MHSETQDKTHVRILIYALIVIAAVILLRNAWVCDDAYISFRTVDNFVNGYGLTWNTDERVQSFTNPLWVIFISAFYLITGDIYYTSIFVSLVLSLFSVVLISTKISRSTWGGILAIVLMIGSKAFVDYSTSGLETVLNYLILSGFYCVLIKNRISNNTFFRLSLLASLGTLNRMDTILLYLPVLLYVFFRLRNPGAVVVGLLGFMPFILWEMFSVVYYGFPFPNTYYAKLHAGVPMLEQIWQGLFYYLDSLNVDPLTVTVILIGPGLALALKDRKNLWFAFGLVLYLLYIMRVGGDFMTGRFLALPFLASVILISQYAFGGNWVTKLTPFGLALLLIAMSPRSPILSDKTYGTHGESGINEKGIADERAWYYQSTGLLRDSRAFEMPTHDWVDRGKRYRVEGKTLYRESCVGFTGFYAGPNVHIYDGFALTDALVSRLPTYRKRDWRTGHLSRVAPWGYTKTLETGENLISDSNLSAYYLNIRLITRGDIFDIQRFKAIWRINTGRIDSLVEKYSSPPHLVYRYSDVSTPKPEGTVWNEEGAFVMRQTGIQILLDSVYRSEELEISVDHNDYYEVIFYSDSTELGFLNISRLDNELGGLRVDTLEVPANASLAGYNNIRVIPLTGDDLYSVGHLRLLE